MKLSRRRLLALLAAALGSSALPASLMAATRSKSPVFDDLSPEVRAFAGRFSRNSHRWLLLDPLYRVAERVRPGAGGGPGRRAELDDMFEECLSSEQNAWYSVEAHLGEANYWVAGELEEDRHRWARMSSSDRAFIFDILGIRKGQLPRAKTLGLLQMSGDDVGRIAARFNHPSRRRVA